MAIYVYNSTTGVLVSWCPNDGDPVAPDADLAAQGLVAVTGLAPLDDTHAWDQATKSVVTVAAPIRPKPITAGIWMTRFTMTERSAIRASTDPVVVDLLFLIAHQPTIDLNDQHLIDGVNYLVSVALISPARVAAIMA